VNKSIITVGLDSFHGPVLTTETLENFVLMCSGLLLDGVEILDTKGKTLFG